MFYGLSFIDKRKKKRYENIWREEWKEYFLLRESERVLAAYLKLSFITEGKGNKEV